ncbi:MAG: cyclic nucleotide-binding domain-containing protein [Deltaproteobacteria bacterium]|nr:cyclic nucleotide-binding domain-containing protein [Deltaproteobacteria bacterium]
MSNKSVLSGKLAFLGLPDVLQILGSAKATGVLKITSQFNPGMGRIYFSEGNPVNGSNGSLKGLKAVYSLFGWTDGTFEFLQGEVSADRVIKKSRMEIILDALKLLDDGAIERVGPPDLVDQSEGESSLFPVVKGPLPDYLYVIEEEEYRDGEQIVKEGGFGKWIWVILEGKVRISKDTGKEPLTVAIIGEGSFIGTFSSFLFKENARSATATTIGEVRLGLLDNERLAREFENLSPEIRKYLISLDRRLGRITERAVELTMRKDSLKGLRDGKKLFMKMGSSKEGLYLIRDGEALVVGKSERGYISLFRLGQDDFIGSVSSMDHTHEPRTASVLATENLSVTEIEPVSFQEECEEIPEILKNLANNICIDIAMTTKLLYRIVDGK